jgi:mRNA interferase RelE/StbE
MYEVLLHPDAQKFYVSADEPLAKKIARCLQQLEQTPRSHPNIKALKGDYAGYYRYRIGHYRVIYTVNDELVEVLVVAIATLQSALLEKLQNTEALEWAVPIQTTEPSPAWLKFAGVFKYNPDFSEILEEIKAARDAWGDEMIDESEYVQ